MRFCRGGVLSDVVLSGWGFVLYSQIISFTLNPTGGAVHFFYIQYTRSSKCIRTQSVYCKCSSSVLPSMGSFDLQRCTGNESWLSVNRNSVYSLSFYGELQPPALYKNARGPQL